MKKFGFAAIIVSGLAAGLVGVAAPTAAVASAEALPVIELPGYSTGADGRHWVGATHPQVTVLMADPSSSQGH